MINFEQELVKYESGLDREEVKKVVMADGGDGNSMQQNKLDQIMKRYGLALNYCKTDSYDLAYIQIQKVARLLPGNINVQLLSALICMHEGKDELAMQALERAAALDGDHPDIKRYQEELHAQPVPQPEEVPAAAETTEAASDHVSVKEDDKKVIKEAKKAAKKQAKQAKKAAPAEKSQTKPKKVIANGSDFEEVTSNKRSFLYIGIGFVIGVIAMLILVVPTMRSSEQNRYASETAGYEDQLKAKDSEITTLQADLKTAQEETEDAKKEADSYKNGNKALYQAADYYIAGQTVDAADALMDIDTDALTTKAAKNLYNTIKDKTYSTAATTFYGTGYNAFNSGNYDEAITNLRKAIKANDSNVYYHYFLARSYEAAGKTENAIKKYEDVLEMGGTTFDSRSRLEKLQQQTEDTSDTTEDTTAASTEN